MFLKKKFFGILGNESMILFLKIGKNVILRNEKGGLVSQNWIFCGFGKRM